MIRVVLADDHAVVRRGLRQMLGEVPDIEVTGEAQDYGALVAVLRQVACDVLVLDVSMPGRNGIEALKSLREQQPALRVIVFSSYPEDQYALRALKAGASGYVTKDAPPDDLIGAIRVAAAGKKYLTPAVAQALAERLHEKEVDGLPHQALSDREFETLRLIASGKKLSEIALALCLSPKTVSVYRARLIEKMNLHTNAELAQYAVKHGLLD